MSIKKQYSNARPICKVTFRLSKEEANDAKQVFLVGEFNQWNEVETPMKAIKKGGFTVTIELEAGKEYRFRYLFDRLYWGNDQDADGYEYCSFGNCDNSILSL